MISEVLKQHLEEANSKSSKTRPLSSNSQATELFFGITGAGDRVGFDGRPDARNLIRRQRDIHCRHVFGQVCSTFGTRDGHDVIALMQ